MADTWTEVSELPDCQVCTLDPPAKAYADCKSNMGPWGFMCRKCFGEFGTGLGLGKGQELRLKMKVNDGDDNEDNF